ncbi:hypothetical protein VNO77_11890 [Canavalia gladiata]|uniref:Uncharacterized protein n=1 Tax=Canavalia gladiata TaxID=3824 RepID=A0AAN9M030_CANGL
MFDLTRYEIYRPEYHRFTISTKSRFYQLIVFQNRTHSVPIKIQSGKLIAAGHVMKSTQDTPHVHFRLTLNGRFGFQTMPCLDQTRSRRVETKQ